MENDADPPNVPTYTPSSCQVRATAWTLQLVASDVVVTKDGIAEVPRFILGIPWSMAKVLHQVIGKTIQHYEANEGTIAVPASVQKSIDQQSKPRAE